MNTKVLLFLTVLFTVGYGTAQTPDPTALIKEVQEAAGGTKQLYALADVQFDYDYTYPQQGISDVSVERYIFDGEHSWGKYTKHQINVMPDKEGEVIQAYVNHKPACMMDGKMMENEEIVALTEFLRKANYFWFTMNFKLNDAGTIHEYLGEETIEDQGYHKVKVTYDADETGKAQNDGYIVFINQDTKLIDEFYFSLPMQGVNDIIIKMEVDYEKMNGIQVPSKRYIYMPGEDGKLGTEPALVQTSTNITFNNGFEPSDLMIKG